MLEEGCDVSFRPYRYALSVLETVKDRLRRPRKRGYVLDCFCGRRVEFLWVEKSNGRKEAEEAFSWIKKKSSKHWPSSSFKWSEEIRQVRLPMAFHAVALSK